MSLRPIVWIVLGIAVLAVVVLSYVGRMPGVIPSNDLPGGKAAPADAHVVYSGQTADDGRLACTTQSASFELRVWVCTEWTILHAGQVAVPAADASGRCKVRHVDQATGRWVCDVPLPPVPTA